MMKKTKMSVEENCAKDRLSELPDSLIFHLFRYLPTTDIIRTTLLSKRWANLWTTITWFDFNDSTIKNKDRFLDFVNGALNSWRGTKISYFIVKFSRDLWKSVTHDDIDSWVLFATTKGVEHLQLLLPEPPQDKTPYLVPQYIQSSSCLKILWLTCCGLESDGEMVQWDRLEFLFIVGGGHSENSINRVLCGSPKLEFLLLGCHSKSSGNLSIRSSSLKTLSVINTRWVSTELRIWTPKLERITIAGIPYSKCLMADVSSSLTDADLRLIDPIYFDGRMVPQILPPLEHVERVHLSDWCIKALRAMTAKSMPSPFPNARILELEFFSHEYEQILGVLELFPKLRNLVLETTTKGPQPESEEGWLKFDRSNFPNLFLMHLRTVDVTWTKGDDSIFPLIDYLLKYARNIEKMVVWENGAKPRKLLLKMGRSSLTDEFIFDRTKLYL